VICVEWNNDALTDSDRFDTNDDNKQARKRNKKNFKDGNKMEITLKSNSTLPFNH